MLVPPLLFIPFVQHIMELTHEQQILLPVSLDIHLKDGEGYDCIHLYVSALNLLRKQGDVERISKGLDVIVWRPLRTIFDYGMYKTGTE